MTSDQNVVVVKQTHLKIPTVKSMTVCSEVCSVCTTVRQIETGAQCLNSLNMLAIELVYTARGVRFTSVGSPEACEFGIGF